MTIDFLPAANIKGLRTWVIDESTIVAMYMNNRAVEALTVGNIDDAYWYAREADPAGSPVPDGVQHARRRLSAARQPAAGAGGVRVRARARAGQHAIDVQPRGRAVRERADGGGGSADAQARADRAQSTVRLFQARPCRDGEGRLQARTADVLEGSRPRRVLPRVPVLVGTRLSRPGRYRKRAGAHLAIAEENSTTRDDRDLYAAKLAHLNGHPQIVHDRLFFNRPR